MSDLTRLVADLDEETLFKLVQMVQRQHRAYVVRRLSGKSAPNPATLRELVRLLQDEHRRKLYPETEKMEALGDAE